MKSNSHEQRLNWHLVEDKNRILTGKIKLKELNVFSKNILLVQVERTATAVNKDFSGSGV